MRALFRLISSAKLTIFLLFLFAVCSLLALAGINSNAMLKAATLDKGFASYPILGILGLLLLNQFFAILYNLFFSGPELPKESENVNDFDSDPDFQQFGLGGEPDSSEPIIWVKEMTKSSADVESYLPSENAVSFLEMLGFRITKVDDEFDGSETISAQKGGGKGWYALSIHIGVLLITAGFFASIAVAPAQRVSIPLNKSVELGKKIKTFYRTNLHSFDLLKGDKSVLPSMKVTLKRLNHTYQHTNFVKQSQNRIKRWETSLEVLFKEKGKYEIQKTGLYQMVGTTATLDFGNGEALVQLSTEETVSKGAYKMSFLGEQLKMKVQVGAEQKTFNSFKSITVGKQKIVFTGLQKGFFHPSGYLSKVCVRWLKKGKKKLIHGCLPVNQKLMLGETPISIQSVQQFALVQYRKKGIPFFPLGMIFFILGFIGYWWPTRYHATVKWRKGQSSLSVVGTGLNVAPKVITQGFYGGLYCTKTTFPSNENSGSGGSGGSGGSSGYGGSGRYGDSGSSGGSSGYGSSNSNSGSGGYGGSGQYGDSGSSNQNQGNQSSRASETSLPPVPPPPGQAAPSQAQKSAPLPTQKQSAPAHLQTLAPQAPVQQRQAPQAPVQQRQAPQKATQKPIISSQSVSHETLASSKRSPVEQAPVASKPQVSFKPEAAPKKVNPITPSSPFEKKKSETPESSYNEDGATKINVKAQSKLRSTASFEKKEIIQATASHKKEVPPAPKKPIAKQEQLKRSLAPKRTPSFSSKLATKTSPQDKSTIPQPIVKVQSPSTFVEVAPPSKKSSPLKPVSKPMAQKPVSKPMAQKPTASMQKKNNDNLDLDSLFAGLDSGTGNSNSEKTSIDTPILNNLDMDIDDLFKNLESGKDSK